MLLECVSVYWQYILATFEKKMLAGNDSDNKVHIGAVKICTYVISHGELYSLRNPLSPLGSENIEKRFIKKGGKKGEKKGEIFVQPLVI